MSTILLTDTGDVDVTNGKVSLLNVDGSRVVEETKQRLRIKLSFFLGEWFLDPRIGIPYVTHFFEKGISVSAVRAILREAIFSDEQVSTVDSLSMDFDRATRTLSCSFHATLVGGQVLEFSEFILGGNR